MKKLNSNKERVRYTESKIIENGKTFSVRLYTTKTHLNSLKPFSSIFGACVYYYNGRIHRELGPAVEGFKEKDCKVGIRIWVRNGKIHNDFGPAVKYSDGSRYAYMKNGLLHRLNNLPACEDEVSIEYRVNGKYHRTDGPALVYKKAIQQEFNQFWINGVKFPDEESKINFERKDRLDWILDSSYEPLKICVSF